MPAWPGGPCPNCGEYMPPKMIHCMSCRVLLNEDLDPDSVEVPQFEPLQEIDAMIDVQPAGFFVGCPHCQRELRIAGKYRGEKVQCRFCDGRFTLDFSTPDVTLIAIYAQCPHCEQELRAREKYLDTKVACKHCGGKIHLLNNPA